MMPVRTTTSDILSGLDYTVRAASGGVEALALLDKGDTIDLLLTDVVMPGMSGPELARRVRVSRPHLPIVFISGYANPEGIAGETLARLVRKPFSASDLREQIEEAMNEFTRVGNLSRHHASCPIDMRPPHRYSFQGLAATRINHRLGRFQHHELQCYEYPAGENLMQRLMWICETIAIPAAKIARLGSA